MFWWQFLALACVSIKSSLSISGYAARGGRLTLPLWQQLRLSPGNQRAWQFGHNVNIGPRYIDEVVSLLPALNALLCLPICYHLQHSVLVQPSVVSSYSSFWLFHFSVSKKSPFPSSLVKPFLDQNNWIRPPLSLCCSSSGVHF